MNVLTPPVEDRLKALEEAQKRSDILMTKHNIAMSKPPEPKTPCSRTMGHGECCWEGHLCDQCAAIHTLQARNAELEDQHSHTHVPTLERVREAHTAMSLEAMSEPTDRGHRVYAQSADERCYLCALIILAEKAEAEIKRLRDLLQRSQCGRRRHTSPGKIAVDEDKFTVVEGPCPECLERQAALDPPEPNEEGDSDCVGLARDTQTKEEIDEVIDGFESEIEREEDSAQAAKLLQECVERYEGRREPHLGHFQGGKSLWWPDPEFVKKAKALLEVGE